MTDKKNDDTGAADDKERRQSAEVKKFTAAGRGRKCASCDNPVDTRFRPFCSKRCADLDLGRWFREDYRIPTQELPEGDEDLDGGGDGDRERDPS